MWKKMLVTVLVFSVILSGCTPRDGEQPTIPIDIQEAPTQPSATSIEGSVTQTKEKPQIPTTVSNLSPLPADPQRVEFLTEDDITLVGYHYPAAVNPAPVVVLMHWANGDQTDWLYVGMVSWLQNRNAEIPVAGTKKDFDTPYPFSPLSDDISFGVFTFDFRGYGESGFAGERSKHIMDARAAYKTAAELEGVDPSRVVGIGASIGADGVVDGCDTCAGALSLGPGDYLDLPYADAMKTMGDAGKPVWCMAAENDLTSFYKCKDLSGVRFVKQIYPTGGHAMRLFRAENSLQPPVEEEIVKFLTDILELPE